MKAIIEDTGVISSYQLSPIGFLSPHIVKAARLDLLTSQPTFCKGRKGEEKW